MQVGHTPTATPRGSRFMVVDYERPRTHENNCIIDLLAPDSHQNWRGTLRHSHLKLWCVLVFVRIHTLVLVRVCTCVCVGVFAGSRGIVCGYICACTYR